MKQPFTFLAFLTLLVGRASAADKPNILFLFADDQRADTIAAHGNPHIKTPNLDRLAAAGFSFRSNYCFGGNSGAVCVPSRAMLMSGKTWFHVDTVSLKGAKLLPELLAGKRLRDLRHRQMAQRPALLAARLPARKDHHVRRHVGSHQGAGPRPRPRRQADRTSARARSSPASCLRIRPSSFSRATTGRSPSLPTWPSPRRTIPGMPPLRYRETYYRNLPPLPANFLPQLPFDNGMMKGGRDENLAAWPRTEAIIRDQLAEYYGLITHMDEQMGRILAALKQSGQADNTLIIYAADNGLALGSHGLLGKQSVFEHSMRVPLIFAGPGIPRGKSTQAFSYLLDVFPDAVRRDRHRSVRRIWKAKACVPLWEGKKDRVRDSVFLPFIQIQRAVRDERWKLICYPKIGHMQLFDLQTDPDETTNLIDRPEQCRTRPAPAEADEAMAGQGRRHARTAHREQAARKGRSDGPET